MKGTLVTTLSGAVVVTSLLTTTAPARAFMFGNDGIRFQQNTTVEFGFYQSNGAFQSQLQVFEVLTGGGLAGAENGVLITENKASDNGAANGFRGTLGNAVSLVNNTFTFLANKVYTLGLVSTYKGKAAATVYSTTGLNTWNTQQAVFGSAGGIEGVELTNRSLYKSANPFQGPVAISFEDIQGGGDLDFNDFSVTANAVPEPLSMGGLALGAAGLMAARRRRNRPTSHAK